MSAPATTTTRATSLGDQLRMTQVAGMAKNASINAGRFITMKTNALSSAASLMGFVPLVAGALKVRLYDMMEHHRRSVLQHHKMPNRRGGQKLIGKLYRKYVQDDTAKDGPELHGEMFMFSQDAQKLVNLETGGNITSRESMAVPIGITAKKLRSLIRQRKVMIAPRKGKTALLVEVSRGRLRKGEHSAGIGRGSKSVIRGVLTRHRRQRALLGFYKQFDDVLPRHGAKFDRTIAQMADEAAALDLALSTAQLAGLKPDTFFRRLKRGGELYEQLRTKGKLIARRANEAGATGGGGAAGGAA